MECWLLWYHESSMLAMLFLPCVSLPELDHWEKLPRQQQHPTSHSNLVVSEKILLSLAVLELSSDLQSLVRESGSALDTLPS
eukprot:2570089-Amphidinium_carterae.3